MIHKTVLLNEIVDALNLCKGGGVVVDGTFGGGGHSLDICHRYKGVKIIALDQDKSAWRNAKEKFSNVDCDITFVNSNFQDLDQVLKEKGILKVNGVILDLGISSDQLESSGRGFSFLKDEPLYMTMKEDPTEEDLTAMDIVNTWSEENIGKIIEGYGEEKFWRKIAGAIA